MKQTRWNPLPHRRQALRRVRSLFRKRWHSKTYLDGRKEHDTAIKGLARVVRWLAKRGWRVEFSQSEPERADHGQKVVYIRTRPGAPTQLVYLLHELGHIVLGMSPGYARRFGRGWELTTTKKKRDNVHRVQLIEEEFEAWNTGETMAMKLGVKFDRVLWNRLKPRCLRSYMQWALNATQEDP